MKLRLLSPEILAPPPLYPFPFMNTQIRALHQPPLALNLAPPIGPPLIPPLGPPLGYLLGPPLGYLLRPPLGYPLGPPLDYLLGPPLIPPLGPPLGYPLGPPLGYLLGPGMKWNLRMSLDPPHSIFFYPLNIQLSKNVAYNLFTRIYNQLSFLPEPGPS